MDLDEWLWRKRLTIKQVAKETEICPATLSHIKNKKISPNLQTALTLREYSNGEIELLELLPKNKSEKIKKVCSYKHEDVYKESCN